MIKYYNLKLNYIIHYKLVSVHYSFLCEEITVDIKTKAAKSFRKSCI